MNDVVTLIVNKDFSGLNDLLEKQPSLANAGIPIPGCNNGNKKLGHPLHRICDAVIARLITEKDAIQLASIFLQHKALIDGFKDKGDINTPLIAASSLYAEQLGLFYIENGADIFYAEPQDGSTALHWAAFCGLKELTKKLIEKGAEVDRRDKKYNAVPAEWAAHSIATSDINQLTCQMDCIRLLFAAGANQSLLSAEALRLLRDANK